MGSSNSYSFGNRNYIWIFGLPCANRFKETYCIFISWSYGICYVRDSFSYTYRNQCGNDRNGRARCNHWTVVLLVRLYGTYLPHKRYGKTRRKHEVTSKNGCIAWVYCDGVIRPSWSCWILGRIHGFIRSLQSTRWFKYNCI